MDFPLRSSMVLSLLTGCFAPDNAVSGSDGDSTAGDSTDGVTSGPSTSATTASTTVSTSSEPSDTSLGETADPDTTAGDAPPELSNFSVNGSETPSEILEADMVEIQVAADDDVGIDRVEFYDGEELIASFTEPPYRTEFLVTSTENGGHSYTAVAYDTAEQSAEAGPIPLSVSIDGGAVLQLREDIFRSRTGFSIFGTPKVSVDDADRVFVSGTSQYVGAGFSKGRWTILRYSPELGLLWEEAYPSSMTSTSPNRSTTSAIKSNADGLWITTISLDGGEYTAALNSYALDDGSLGGVANLPETGTGPYPLRGLATDSTGNRFVAKAGGLLAKFAPGDSTPEWETNVLEGQPEDSFVVGVSTNADGDALVDIACFLAACEESALRKVSADGDLLWTRDNGFASVGLPDGSSVSAYGAYADTNLQVWHRDADGNEIETSVVDEVFMIPIDIAATPDGDVVVAGIRDDSPIVPVVARVTTSGELVWMIEPEVGAGETAVASGVAVTSGGRLYVAGTANSESEGLLGNEVGDAWVAELAL